jgi:pimeloyl-ACP methyl ester carboxylesterase
MRVQVFKTEAGERAVHALYRQVLDGWFCPKEELRLPTREGETFVVAYGAEDLPPLILLHGAQSNAAVWMLDAPSWSKSFRCYAVDMIGEAGFSAPSRPPLDSEAHALWLDDLMQGLGLRRAAFVGVSLGGWLALDYAKRRPGAVEKMALLCPAGIGRQKNFLLKAAPLLLLGPWGRRKFREMVFGPFRGEPPPALRPLAEMIGAIGRAIRPRVVSIPRLSDAELAGLEMPMLVIVGGKDVLIDTEDTRHRLARFAPHAQVVYLPEARHAIFGQSPRILEFLEAPPSPEGKGVREVPSPACGRAP